ncbi:amidohydrolase [Micrococcus sp.]|uniref:amidohydrolase n=1 Tax=Micrococcus sp. TaxID=1271 RepID=UPI002A90DDCC|nr:amidohydrolase [Micrococcus sp.]MDY6054540.1 amidohydrolase [Micrococcus sp.]
MSTAASTVLAALADQQQWQEEYYRHLHAHPELSMQETETLAEISRRLEGFGYRVQGIGGGVVGVLENGEGPTVLFRADVDGLPVQEQTGLDYASTATRQDRDGLTQPVMHACGHDVHATAALGAAALLAEARQAWSGTYIALFQPGEETAEGAAAMVADGLAEKVPTPDVCLGQHVVPAPAGLVGVRSGAALSTAISMKITVHGAGTHGSMPHQGVDPVVLASSIVMRLQTVVSRELDPDEFGVVTVGSLHAGSTANVISDRAVLRVNFRAYSPEVRAQLTEAVERIVRAECAAARSPKEPEFTSSDDFPLTHNDDAATSRVRAAFEARFGQDRVVTQPRGTASEDFSRIPDAFGAPYCYWVFGGLAEGQEPVANHSPFFAPTLQPTLSTGTEAAVTAALAWLGAQEG